MTDPSGALPSTTRRRLLAAGLGAVGGALLAGCSQLPLLGSGQVASGGASAAGLPAAPPLGLELFSGGQFSLVAQRGKLVFVNFWASWCVPCKTEMPTFERAWQQYRDQGVLFVGANVQDLERDARHFLEQEVHITYTVGRATDDEQVSAYKVSGLPTSVVVTRDGKLAQTWLGALSEDKLKELLLPYL